MSVKRSDACWVRARPVSRVLFVVVLAALFLPQAGAAAIGGTPAVTVNPNAGLADGQPVSVVVTDFPANTGIGIVECPATATPSQDECELGVPPTATTDGSGAVSLTYSARRVIFTRQLGRVDCAQAACVLAVGTAVGPFVSATAPVGFVDTQLPPPPFSLTLEGPHFLNGHMATIGARLTCDRTASVHVVAELSQPPSGDMQTVGASDYDYACAAGADLHIFTDYIRGFQAGDAYAVVWLSVGVGGPAVAAAVGTVTLQSDADTAAALRAAAGRTRRRRGSGQADRRYPLAYHLQPHIPTRLCHGDLLRVARPYAAPRPPFLLSGRLSGLTFRGERAAHGAGGFATPFGK